MHIKNVEFSANNFQKKNKIKLADEIYELDCLEIKNKVDFKEIKREITELSSESQSAAYTRENNKCENVENIFRNKEILNEFKNVSTNFHISADEECILNYKMHALKPILEFEEQQESNNFNVSLYTPKEMIKITKKKEINSIENTQEKKISKDNLNEFQTFLNEKEKISKNENNGIEVISTVKDINAAKTSDILISAHALALSENFKNSKKIHTSTIEENANKYEETRDGKNLNVSNLSATKNNSSIVGFTYLSSQSSSFGFSKKQLLCFLNEWDAHLASQNLQSLFSSEQQFLKTDQDNVFLTHQRQVLSSLSQATNSTNKKRVGEIENYGKQINENIENNNKFDKTHFEKSNVAFDLSDNKTQLLNFKNVYEQKDFSRQCENNDKYLSKNYILLYDQKSLKNNQINLQNDFKNNQLLQKQILERVSTPAILSPASSFLCLSNAQLSSKSPKTTSTNTEQPIGISEMFSLIKKSASNVSSPSSSSLSGFSEKFGGFATKLATNAIKNTKQASEQFAEKAQKAAQVIQQQSTNISTEDSLPSDNLVK